MKSKLVFGIVLLLCSSAALAQEWSLKVDYIINNNPTPVRSVIFGYDIAASDSMIDQQWSESPLPSLSFPGDPDLRLTNRILGRGYLQAEGNNGGLTDIRRKPALDSFILSYEISLALPDLATAARLEWNPASIPSIIKHIYLISEAGNTAKYQKDMTVDSQLDIPTSGDSLHYFDNILIRVLYNTQVLGVPTDKQTGISTIYPSVAPATSNRYITSDKEQRLQLILTDMLGRTIAHTVIEAHRGVNVIPEDLFNSDIPDAGMYIVTISDELGRSLGTMQKIIVE